jgi:hypothetical protein
MLQGANYGDGRVTTKQAWCTHLVLVDNVDDGGQLAVVRAIVDQDHTADLHETGEQLQIDG